MIDAATLAVVGGAMYIGHTVADHWLQTERQAVTKGADGWPGRLACARHVATLTATQLVAVLAVAALCGLDLAPGWVALGLAVNAATHWWADRRSTLVRLADISRAVIPGGKGGFVRLGDPVAAPCGTGAYALDQSWHGLWLAVASLLIAL